MKDKRCLSELQRRRIQTWFYAIILFAVSTESRNVRLTTWSSKDGSGLEIYGCGTPPPQDPKRCENDWIVNEAWIPSQQEHRSRSPPPPTEGITLTVLNQRTATLIFTKVFPLDQYWARYVDLQWHMDRVASGRVVVITVAVSGTVGLRQAAHQLAQLGSLFALHLTPMAHWTWVFVKGGRTISETVILRGVAQHHAHLLLPLSDLPSPTQSSNQSLQQQRWQYCQLHGAMGGLCDEHSPDPLPPPSPPTLAHQSALANVPVVVTAGARHQYLYHTLNTLLAAPGAQRSNVLVVLGDAPQPTTQLLRLINVNFTQVPVHGKDNFKLFRYYRSVFQLVARTFPDAPAVIFLDEDVEVSPDFFSFMSQTLWLLREDPTLYCINTYSATGLKDRAFHPSRVLRGSLQVSWGYALPLYFIREALSIWPNESSKIYIYDYWMYRDVRRGRECVYPEISRSFHFGVGMNSDAILDEKTFLSKPLLQEAYVDLMRVSDIQIDSWRRQLSQNISHATVLRGNPCSPNFIPSDLSNSHYVFYYRLDKLQENLPNPEQFHHLFNCVYTWTFSEQGLHEGVAIVTLSVRTTLYLVGVPYSSYSYLRPPRLLLWDIDTIPEEEYIIVEKNEINNERFPFRVSNVDMTEEKLTSILSIS
ncbi:protein O-linked-mannose beta-1,2-N-acetylglucosaminyltransferase 1-like [Penaeus japonicus]|uniref:protein O-linked-mannose beta-1,2-N-acetylglucosaminyltransferase 1-like n=1 Tax=Penaeus japonicus TaxID=27405 RepID=UPI001C70C737|nr:protein O-linked-mannose beta-1,2-N-acetylglucosaminyltransferase 1-like [Penaeus japonicus]XP_042892170.1 protein O-linked-mannose beta-1,2-N-acetylglucosaminyltransferase 1-like [Penaeus japonicus]